MAMSGIKLRQCDPTLELFISTPTRDLLLGGPGKKGFWLEIGSGDQMSDADREPGEGDAAGSKQQQTGAEGQARLNRGSGRSGPGSELVPCMESCTQHSSPFVNKGWPGPRDIGDNLLRSCTHSRMFWPSLYNQLLTQCRGLVVGTW